MLAHSIQKTIHNENEEIGLKDEHIEISHISKDVKDETEFRYQSRHTYFLDKNQSEWM
jgi:hypothetical protein